MMLHRFRPSPAVIALVALLGCDGRDATDGGVTDTGADAATDSGLGDAGADPGPDIPWLAAGAPPIVLTPCPDGWREVPRGGVTECDPFPVGGQATCGPGEAHFLGEAGCRAIGDPCPAGDYADALPATGPVVYVKAGASAGGDGSRVAPYGRLSEVPWASLAANATVALAKGSYSETMALPAGLRVVGACVAETFLTGLDGTEPAVVTVTGTGAPAVVRNITITGAPRRGVEVRGGQGLTLVGVLVEGARQFGVAALQADSVVTLVDTVVRDTRADPADGRAGEGVHVELGPRVDATRVLISGGDSAGVFAFDPESVVVLRDVLVSNTSRESGLVMLDGATLEAERVLIEGHGRSGVLLSGVGTAATLADVVVRDGHPVSADPSAGSGIVALTGARLDAIRSVVTGARGIGVGARGDGSEVVLSDFVIRDVTGQLADSGGKGLLADGGARAEAARLLIDRASGIGVVAYDPATEILLTDVLVRDTRLGSLSSDLGRGLQAEDESRVAGVRLSIEGSREAGIVSVSGARVKLSDTSVTGIVSPTCTSAGCPVMPYGYGAAAAGGTLRLTDFRIDAASTCGVFVARLPGDEFAPALDLSRGVISACAIGACLQVDGYDLERLSNDVIFRDNTANLDVTTLPVPGPSSL